MQTHTNSLHATESAKAQKHFSVRSGLDVLVEDQFRTLQGQRVALLGHPASVDHRLQHLLDLCLSHGVNVVRLFGPEHGLRGDAQDMAHVEGHTDSRTGLEVISLYGKTHDSLLFKPEHLRDVDVLVCDLQDIGSRYYTFAYTVAFAMRTCAQMGIRCVVLDRPNPIGGLRVEGNVVEAGFASFVGEYPLATQHGMTLGELCAFFVEHDEVLQKYTPTHEVIWMQNWRRHMFFEDTHLPWVLPSPNMPTVDTAIVYPGGCLIEGTNLSEGRGTTRPFELIGAPYIDDPYRFADTLLAHLPQISDGAQQSSSHHQHDQQQTARLRPCYFRPTFQKHGGQLCAGVQIHVVDRRNFSSLAWGLATLSAAQQCTGFTWRREAYEFVEDKPAIDLLLGNASLREALDKGATGAEVWHSMQEAGRPFVAARARWLHAAYDG